MKRLLHLVVLFVAATVLVAGAWALHRQDPESPTLASARARWERLSPDEKEQMRERYERYRALSEDERRALADRARRMREDREELHRRLPAEAREKLSKLPPEKRREVMHELFENEAREKGARIREKMPESWIERLEKAPPEERARFLNEFQKKARQRVSYMALDKIGAKLELPKEEIERLKALPLEERSQAILDLRKRLSTRDAAQFGLPEGITQDQWDQWQALPPEQFFETMQRYRCEQESRNGRREPTEAEKAAQRDQARLWMALGEALRPRPEDVIQSLDLPSTERRKQAAVRRRDRVLGVLVDHQLVSVERLDELRVMPEREFMEAMKDVLPPPMPRWFHGRHDSDDALSRRGRDSDDARPRRGSDGEGRGRHEKGERGTEPCPTPGAEGDTRPPRKPNEPVKREGDARPHRGSGV